MKKLFVLFLCATSWCGFSQTLQLHYDLRGTLDPERNPKNFPTLYFEYFKSQDSGRHFIKPGSFLLKMQTDFLGEKNNMGKFYMQVSQSLRAWSPKIFLNLQYSGGLGLTDPRQYSYYIRNTWSLGISYPFQWGNAWLNAVLNYKYLPYTKASHDPLFTLYWWKGLWHYKGEFSGDFSVWTENKNHGDETTKDLHGKNFYFFAEPQYWYSFLKDLSVGTKITVNYHVLLPGNILQVYPTLALRCKL